MDKRVRVFFWIFWIVLLVMLVIFTLDMKIYELNFDPPGTAPTGGELSTVRYISNLIHHIEFILLMIFVGLLFDMTYVVQIELTEVMEKGNKIQTEYNKATRTVLFCLSIYLLYKFIVNFFIQRQNTVFHIGDWDFSNYGEFLGEMWLDLICVSFILIAYANFIFRTERLMNLRTKGLFSIFPLIGLIMYFFGFNLTIILWTNLPIALGAASILGLHLYIVIKGDADMRKHAGSLFVGLALLLLASLLDVNTDLAAYIWDGSQISISGFDIFLESFLCPTVGILAYFFFKRAYA